MANRKISDLTALTAPAAGDLLPIVDISEALAVDKNKRIALSTLLGGAPLGSAAAPTFAFSGYPSTGIYSSGANQVAIATAGTGQVFVTSAGLVGIGTAAPGGILDINKSGASTTPNLVLSSGGVGDPSTVDPSIQFSASGFESQGTTKILSTGAFNARALAFHTGPDTAGTEKVRTDSSGRLLVGGSADSGGALFQVFGDRIRIGTAKTPASASATGTAGEICWDASYIYVCTATNTWKRTAIATW